MSQKKHSRKVIRPMTLFKTLTTALAFALASTAAQAETTLNIDLPGQSGFVDLGGVEGLKAATVIGKGPMLNTRVAAIAVQGGSYIGSDLGPYKDLKSGEPFDLASLPGGMRQLYPSRNLKAIETASVPITSLKDVINAASLKDSANGLIAQFTANVDKSVTAGNFIIIFMLPDLRAGADGTTAGIIMIGE